jgi:predicted Kef-type K+ transport protein
MKNLILLASMSPIGDSLQSVVDDLLNIFVPTLFAVALVTLLRYVFATENPFQKQERKEYFFLACRFFIGISIMTLYVKRVLPLMDQSQALMQQKNVFTLLILIIFLLVAYWQWMTFHKNHHAK